MFGIAYKTLLYDRRRLVAALCGVAFASTLVLVQLGIYAGFRETASLLVRRLGGDAWVMPLGTEALENVEPLAPAIRQTILADPCLAALHPLVFVYVNVRQPTGAILPARMIGIDTEDAGRVIGQQVPEDTIARLREPLGVIADEDDKALLRIRDPETSPWLSIDKRILPVVGFTKGTRSLAPSPILFASVETARRMACLDSAVVSMWSINVREAGCTHDLIRRLNRGFDVQALTTDEWADRTERYWIAGSGAGAAIALNSIIGLIVGAVIVGHILLALTHDNLREIATLKAIGGRPRQIGSFVLWQAGLLAVSGGALGLVASFAIQALCKHRGLAIVLSTQTLLGSVLGVLAMCSVASWLALRKIRALSGAEVFA